jgi:hypothetical protein
MKIWWVVAWDYYYPSGGLNNMQSTHSTEEEAIAASKLITTFDNVKVINISSFLE